MSSLIKQNINNKTKFVNKENNYLRDLINEELNLEKDFLDSNISFDCCFNSKNKVLDKDIDLTKIDFIKDKNDEENEIKSILSELDKNIEITLKEKDNYKECQEILNILKKPLSEKNVRFYRSPFKPLEKPRKISMVGKIIFNDTKDDEEDNKSEITQNSSNTNDINNKMINKDINYKY